MKTKAKVGGGAPPLASAPEGPRRTPPNGGHPRNAPEKQASGVEEWDSATLGELVEAKSGFACGEDVTEGTFQFRMNNITIDGQIDLSKKRRVPSNLKNIKEYLLNAGDVLFNATNSPELVGKSAFFPGYVEASTFSNHFLRLRTISTRLDSKYLSRWLNLQFQRKIFQGICKQWVNQATVSRESLLKLKIPLPPLPEQRRIAEVLDRAEKNRLQRADSINSLESLSNSIFQEMFVANASGSWQPLTVAELASPGKGSIRTGPFGSQLLHEEFVNEGVAVLGIDNVVSNEFRWSEKRFVTEEKYRELKRYTVRPGDVLITIMGTCGRCAVVPEGIPTAINTKHLCCISLDTSKCLPGFLHAYFLRHPSANKYLQQASKGAIMDGLNLGIISAMPVKLPPLELQRKFVGHLASLERMKRFHRSSISQIEALFASLQHRAFRGEL